MSYQQTARSNALWRLLFAVTLVTVVAFALYPNLKLSRLFFGIRLIDPILHVVAFASITFVAGNTWRPRILMFGLLVFLALFLEFAQYMAPGREVHLSDAVASLSGIIVGALGVSLFACLRRILWQWMSPKAQQEIRMTEVGNLIPLASDEKR